VKPVQQSCGPVQNWLAVPQQVPLVTLVHISLRLQQAAVGLQAAPTSPQAVQVCAPGVPVHWRPRQHCEVSVQLPALLTQTQLVAPLQLPKQQSTAVLHAPPTLGSEH
jgi:hypothetical protein